MSNVKSQSMTQSHNLENLREEKDLNGDSQTRVKQ